MSFYIIIRGPAGIGKTTIARVLQEKLSAVYISFDEILRKNKLEVSDGRGIAKESFLKANKLVVKEARKKLNKGEIVIFDGCFYHKDQIQNLEKELLFDHYIFDLKAPVEECIERDKERKSIGEEAIRAVYSMVSEFDYGIPVKISRKTVEEVVVELLNIVNLN